MNFRKVNNVEIMKYISYLVDQKLFLPEHLLRLAEVIKLKTVIK